MPVVMDRRRFLCASGVALAEEALADGTGQPAGTETCGAVLHTAGNQKDHANAMRSNCLNQLENKDVDRFNN